MDKLRGDSTRGGHESHLIFTMYICGGHANGRWRDIWVVGNGDVVEDVDGSKHISSDSSTS